MNRSHSYYRRAAFAVWLLTLVLCTRSAHAIVDQNGNGMSDVWEMIYGTGFNPGATDVSGLTYLQESIAGLAPGNPGSFLRATLSTSGTTTVMSWPSVAGKQYQVQTSSVLASGPWTALGNPVPGTGLALSSTVTMAAPASFFRVSVSDVDSNGDGLTDWEALQLRLNPANAYSNGHLDANGQPLSDLNYVAAAVSSSNVVSIVAAKPGATIPDNGAATDSGSLVVTRTGNLNAVTIPLQISSSATPGKDYVALPVSVTLPMGVNSATIPVTPLAGSRLLAGTPVTAAVANSPAYQMGASGTAAVVIYPSTTPSGTGLTGYYYASSSATYSGTANFNPATLKVTRVDPQVSFFWGPGQPYSQVARNNFSASWDGQVSPPSTGNYVFGLQAASGARLYINNQLVTTASTAVSSSSAVVLSGSIPLVSGSLYPVHVEYYDNSDSANIYLAWQPPGTSSLSTIPSANVLRPGTSGSTGWNANYYNNTSLSGTAAYSTVEKSIYWNWGAGSPDLSIPTSHYSARWLGQVQPQYSEPYTFVTHCDDGAMLRVNGQLITNDWIDQLASDVASTTINLQAGVRYDIQMDYFQDTGTAQASLSWYSPSQAQQIIPQNRLYPASLPVAPPTITSSTNVVALLGGSFNYVVAASNSGTNFTVTGLPPGLTFNPLTGVISGIVTQPGIFYVTITATNGAGSGSTTLTINALATGGGITHQIWAGVSGTNVSDIPVSTPPTLTGTLTSLESPPNYGSEYGEQLVGYLTAPVTGNYYFWVAGNSSAELWISNDSDPVNSVKRAAVTNGTSFENWTASPGQQSPWLSLTAGQKYYIQVLHKFGDGTGDNLSVGWLRPDQSGTTAYEVVPGYALSPYTPPASTVQPGTLYSTTMLAAPSVATGGVGAATLVLSPDQTTATLSFNYANLSSQVSDTQLVSDAYLNNPSQVIFDITKFAKQNLDGSYTFSIAAVGSLAAADVLEIIREGKAAVVIGTANNPSGEIRGNFNLTNGAQSFVPPPAPQQWTDDHGTDAGAARFLTQATFGPTPADIAKVESRGYAGWISDQMNLSVTHHLPVVYANPNPFLEPVYPDTVAFNAWWQQSVTAPDQLRQRVAFALSEILVISDVGALNNNGLYLSGYYDTLLDNAFGNYRNLLKAVTLSPAMGNYLNMRNNAKANYPAGLHPDENYAREINQLFSIGLYRLWADGTLVENAAGSLVPTYGQATVQGFAAVFTGWNYYQAPLSTGRLPTNWFPADDYTDPMTLVPSFHDLGAKVTLDNIVLPPATGSQVDPTNVAFDNYCSNDLDAAISAIFNNQNVGPFICRQLIQRLVTSNPSRDYLYRVVQVFNNNGAGVRGDLQAVVKAILLDYEARSPTAAALPGYGKQKEPLLRVTAAARFFGSTVSVSGSYAQNGGQQIVVSSTAANRFVVGDNVMLNFTSGSPLPYSGSYPVTAIGANSFTVSAAGLVPGTYSQSGTTITVAMAHGLSVGNPVYLAFPSGGAVSGTYAVTSVPDANHLTVTAPGAAVLSGTTLLERFTGGYVVSTSGSTQVNTITTSVNHGLNPGDTVFINFSSGSAVTGIYTVLAVPDLMHFTISGAGLVNQIRNSLTIFPLVAPPLTRAGAITAQTSNWNIGSSDTDLTQTPMNSPTVFNYYYPTYRFPGPLASAGLTTPEFQLTNATNAMMQTNFMEGGVLSAKNTNGLISFRNGNGSIEMDLGPYLNMADNNSLPGLVDLLNNQLMSGTMNPAMRSAILSYVTGTTGTTANFSYSSPPTVAQQSSRIRAVVHLILTSPEFTIQQ